MDFTALINMFRQPSTWAGCAVLLQAFGVHVVPDNIVQIGTAIAGTAAVIFNETGAK